MVKYMFKKTIPNSVSKIGPKTGNFAVTLAINYLTPYEHNLPFSFEFCLSEVQLFFQLSFIYDLLIKNLYDL